MKNKKILILSLGGSLIIPQDKIAINFLKKFRVLILKFLKNGYQIVIVTGGGGINRHYNQQVQKIRPIKNQDLDWLGIACSKLNAEFLRLIFSSIAYKKVIANSKTKLRGNWKLIIASGWQPGCSTDKQAVLWAQKLKANLVVNLTDIDYVYDKDPDKYKNAQPIKKINWSDFLKIIGKKWSPRTSAPFGPPASKLAQQLGIKVAIVNGKNMKNISACLKGKDFQGTLIS
jgi:uridylate kinase